MYKPTKPAILCFSGGFLVGFGLELIFEGFRMGKLTGDVINEAENITRGIGETGL